MNPKKKEPMPELPALGCEFCKDSLAPGLIFITEGGERAVKRCICKIARDRARIGVMQSQSVDVKVRAAGGAQ